MEETSMHGDGAIITVKVKFGEKKFPILISPNSTVSNLKYLLLTLTNVLPQRQKLISKGKVLEDSQTLTASDVTDGSNIMLVAYQVDPILKKAEVVPRTKINSTNVNTFPMKERIRFWTINKCIPLSFCNLKAIPDEVWACGSSVKLLECSQNSIENVPIKIESLIGLEMLYLNSNNLSEGSISWEGLTTLKHLTILKLSHNRLTTLPPAFGSLVSLQILYVSYNYLWNLPHEIGHLTKLVLLLADNNSLTTLTPALGSLISLKKLNVSHNLLRNLPYEIGHLTKLEVLMTTISEGIGNCISLVEVDFSSNNLSALPETFSNLTSLQFLYLHNNTMMKSLPSKLFKDCRRLHRVDIHNTEITIDILRKLDGWDKFEERHHR